MWIVALGLFIFAIGEMMASPTSQEYVGRIAPDNKKALYMGYYFVAIALGNLFGGLISGIAYQHFGPIDRGGIDRPGTMWVIFAALALLSAVLLVLGCDDNTGLCHVPSNVAPDAERRLRVLEHRHVLGHRAGEPVEQLRRTVRVVVVEPGPVQLVVRSQGTVVPHVQSELVPEISGRVVAAGEAASQWSGKRPRVERVKFSQ